VRFGNKRVVLCELLPGVDWRTASVEVRVEWAAGSCPSVLCFPDMLPSLLNESFHVRRWPQPTLRCTADLPAVAYVRSPAAENSAFRQLTPYRGDVAGGVQARPSVEIELGTGLSYLGESQQTSVVALLAGLTDFLASELRYDLNSRILALAVKKSRAYPRVWGPCLAEPPATYGETGGRVEHLRLAQDLAGLWWGAGVRLVGNDATHLLMAICVSLGIRWTANVDAARGARCFDGYVRLSRDPQRSVADRLWSRWVVALHEGFVHCESVMNALCSLTAEHYGYYVPADKIRASLSRAGASLD